MQMAPVKVIVVGVTVVLVLLSLVEEGNLKNHFHSDNSADLCDSTIMLYSFVLIAFPTALADSIITHRAG